ncbi:MAG: glycosyltransferase family 9 protein [Ignavibacteriaceae bacterium]
MKKSRKEIEITALFTRYNFLEKLFSFFTNNLLYLLRFFGHSRKSGEGILIVSLHLLGDTVYTIPAIRHLKRDFPNDRISILCFPTGIKLYKLFFSDINTHTVTKSQFIYGRVAKSSVRKTVYVINPRIIIDMTGAITSASSIFLSGARLTGMNQQYYRKIYDDFTPLRTTPHLMEMYMDPIRKILKNPVDYSFFEFESNIKRIDKILIFPFAGWKAKEWSIEYFIEIARWLSKEYTVEFMAEPNQLSPKMTEDLKNNRFKINYSSSLEELFKLISECSLFISNDSGPVHIAQAMGRAVFIIYGPSNPEYSIPFGNNYGFVRKLIDCSPINQQFCHTLAGRKCPTIECMRDLSVETVREKLQIFLKKFETSNQSNEIS